MFIFQLVTRLTEYSFMFHQGVLLLSSALIGASLAMVGLLLVPERYKKYCLQLVPILLLSTWLLYIAIFLTTQSLILHFAILTLVFGALFLLITQHINLKPNQFTAVELIGSFVGAAGLIVLTTFVLEEWLIVWSVVAIGLYIAYSQAWRYVPVALRAVLLGLSMAVIYVFASYSLPELVVCPDLNATYKIACIDTTDTFKLDTSIPNLSGRSDVFINTGGSSPRLSVYKSGLHSGTSLVREEYADLSQQYHDVEIPPLAYQSGSKVAAAGASTGSNVLTFQSYIPEAKMTVVEIDRIITDLYKNETYLGFLPEPGSFDLVYQDARTFFETRNAQFDVISMMVESVNTTLPPYVDESTSLVYTTQALQTYVNALAPGGYLLLQQFHVNGAAGDAMIHKVLGSLEAALDLVAATELEENIILYSYAFSPDPGAQRFLGAVYKPDGFTAADTEQFNTWTMTTAGAGIFITVLHTPDGEHTYELYFDADQRQLLAGVYNTGVITDDKPFRHLVTALPFPREYYWLLLIPTIILLVLVARLGSRIPTQKPLLPIAFGLGLVTFGLQYALYYKTAAFIGTSLIYFSVFLLIPLLFGAVGGYLSYKLRVWQAICLFGLAVIAAWCLLMSTALSLSPTLVVGLLVVLFVFSGTVFPLLLSQVTASNDRLLLYAVNMSGGGAATIMVISLHAVIGWVYLFCVLFGIVSVLFGYLFYLYSKQ